MRQELGALTLSGGVEKKYVGRGTRRICSPGETVSRLRPLLPRIGITRVANVTGLDSIGIPTVIVCRPNSRSLSVSQGKGVDLDAASASGIMESIEQHCAETIEHPIWRRALLDQSRRGATVETSLLPGYVRRLEQNEPIFWINAVDLASSSQVAVPYEMVHLDLTVPLPKGSGCFPVNSNGLASGNNLAEALAHGMYELIERDALARFYRLPSDRQWLRRVCLDTVDDDICISVLNKYEQAGIAVGVWDMTSDIGLPAFYVAIVEKERDPFRRIGKACGFGCHTDRGVALSRALTEAAQSRLTRISGSRDDIQVHDFEAIRSSESIERQQAEIITSEQPPRHFSDAPNPAGMTLEQDVRNTLRCLANAGLKQVLYVDLSKAELPVAVARVIIPGLEGHPEVPGYVPGPRAAAVDRAYS